jgi:hypothetical protein
MQRYKPILAGAILFLFFIIILISLDAPYQRQFALGYIDQNDWFTSALYMGGGYYSLIKYLLFFALPALVTVEYLSPKEKAFLLIRAESPIRNYWNRTKNLTGIAALFMLAYEIAGVAYFLYQFDWACLQRYNFGTFLFYNVLVFFFYYLREGMLYFLLKDILRHPFLVMAIRIALCWIEYMIVGEWYEVRILPAFDFVSILAHLENHVTLLDAATPILRQLVFTAIVWLIGRYIFCRRDFLKDER